MGNLSTFGTFTMARLGIYVSQHALNVTGNNISNINTTGYTRQALDQTSMNYGSADRYQSRFDIRENGGVLATGVDQSRDKYLDIRYRNEMTRVGGMESKLSGLEKLAAIFDEVGRGEDEAGILEARFNDFVQQVQNLNTQGAGKDDFDSLVRKSAEAMVIQFHDYAKQLETLNQTETAEFKDAVSDVNTMLKKIRNLNESIRMSEAFGGSALTQKDERNLLIDELSKKVGINVTYEKELIGEGFEIDKLKITTSGDPERTLVDGVYCGQFELRKDAGEEDQFNLAVSKLYDSHNNPDPQQDDALEIIDFEVDTMAKSSQITLKTGTLTDEEKAENKQALEDAGIKIVTFPHEGMTAQEYEDKLNAFYGYTKPTGSGGDYTYNGPYYHVSGKDDQPGLEDNEFVIHLHEVPGVAYPTASVDEDTVAGTFSYVNVGDLKGVKLNDTELTGGLQASREILTEKGEYASLEEIARDPDAGTKRGIPYYQKALDTLANTFAAILNEANRLPDATVYQMRNGKFIDKNGDEINTVTVDGALTVNEEDRSELVLNDEYSYYDGGVLFSNNGRSNVAEGITAANISISFNWDHGSVHMLRSTTPNAPSELQENLRHILTQLTSAHDFTAGADSHGTTYFSGTFQEMLTDAISSTLAKDQNVTGTMLDNYNATADELYISRDAVMGVDLNDEAMNMMQFQKAYSAACRLMTTYDGMLDKLINGTAV